MRGIGDEWLRQCVALAAGRHIRLTQRGAQLQRTRLRTWPIAWSRLAAGLFALLLCCASSATVHGADRPNVVVIVADDLGAHDLTCYGSKFHRTPQLDALAAGGVRFTQAYAACPVCSPTRAALMTGKWPARLHLTDWLPGRGDLPAQRLARPDFARQLPLSETTLAEVLHEAGYTTGVIGKWHLGGEGFEPRRQGFDFNVAGDHTGTPLSYFAPFTRNGRAMPGLESAPAGEYLTDRLAAEAEKFIDQNRERPFFLYLPHYAVHTPMRAKEAVTAKYPAATTFRGQQNNPIYAAMLESLDDAVGRVVARLKQHGLSDRTIVIFTSDNGGLATVEGPNTPATSNAPLREGKGYLYEGGIRVPLIMQWPGHWRTAATTDALATSVDLWPTLLAACGVTSSVKVDGVSLLPVLDPAGDNQLDRDTLYWHYPHYANQGGRPGGAIRSGEYKLIEFYEQGRMELFHVAKDGGESRNLSADQPDRVKELAARLARWREEVGAQMPTPNPAYRPHPQADNGSITLPASGADVHGVMLRYEPLPHKATLGFWVRREDYATWEFTVDKPGEFDVEVLQGCGPGSGGSEVVVSVGDQAVTFTVQETKGFQDFLPRTIGRLKIATAGRQTLRVEPKSKPGVAVMDLRRVVLTPAKPNE